MPSNAFTITIHMVSSLDGFVAKKDNSVSWFETVDLYEKGIEVSNEAAQEFLKTIDCYVMGARTYEHALELSKLYGWAYGDVPTIVLTHRTLLNERKNVQFYSGDLNKLLNELLEKDFTNVWVVGGPTVAKDFINLKLANEIRLSVLPIILGEGKLFFEEIGIEQALHLKDVRAFKSGMVELCYKMKK